MKLYELFIDNNLDYSDYHCQQKLTVANSQEEANIRAENWMKEEYGDYSRRWLVEEITEVDGFKITVSR